MTTYISPTVDSTLGGTGVQIQGTSSRVLQAQRKFDIADEIKYHDPSESPFVLLADGNKFGIKTKGAVDATFKMFEKEPFAAWTAINYGAGYLTSDVTLTVDSTAHLVAGQSILFVLADNTVEQALISSVASATSIVVVRGDNFGVTASQALPDNTPILALPLNPKEGQLAIPTIKSVQAEQLTNYCEYMEFPHGGTRQLMKSELYGGNALQDLRKEAWIEFMKRTERELVIAGEPKEYISTEDVRYKTGSLWYWITRSGAGGYSKDVNGNLTTTIMREVCANVFKKGSSTKIMLAGAKIIEALDYFKEVKLTMYPKDEVYGLTVREWVTDFGKLLIVYHRQLENSSAGTTTIGWGGAAIIFDPKYVTLRKFEDFHLETNIQVPAYRGRIDRYAAQVGIQVDCAPVHGIIKRVTGYA